MSGDASGSVAGTGQEPGTGRSDARGGRAPRSLEEQIRARGRKSALEMRRQLVESIGPLPIERDLASEKRADPEPNAASRLRQDAFEAPRVPPRTAKARPARPRRR